MAVKKRRQKKPVVATEAPAAEAPAASRADAQESTPDGAPLSDRFATLFGGGGTSSFSAFLAGGSSSSGASVPSTPQRAKASTASAAQQAAAAECLAGASRKRSRAAVEEEEPVEPPRKRRTEEELEERKARTLFVGNIPLPWDKQKLRRAMRTAVGEKYDGQFRPLWFRAEPLEEKWQGNLRKVGSIKKFYAKDGANAKNAYVVLASPEDVTTVRLLVHGYVADDRHVLRADGVGEAAKLVTFDRKRSVFVGNLPTTTSEADLRGVFAPAGQVDAVRVIRDNVKGSCKGFAFVRFKERPSVKAALNMWGVELQQRPLRVMKVTEQEGGDSGAAKSSSGYEHPAEKRMSKRHSHGSTQWWEAPRKQGNKQRRR